MILERDDLSLRNILKLVGGIAVLGAALFLYPKVERRYQRWRHHGTVAQVQKFTAANDAPNAILAIKTAISEQPSNPLVWRMAADFFEQAGDPEAVPMRREVVNLEPDVPANRIALARTALRFKDVLSTREALEEIRESDRHTSEYRQTAAALALASDHPAEAAALLTSAIVSDPGNAQLRLDRAILSLHYGSSKVAASAIGELRALADHGATRRVALRELATAALKDKDTPTALNYAEQLSAQPDCPFVDHLLRANILLADGKVGIGSILPTLEARSIARPGDIPELTAWLIALNHADLAVQWVRSLPSVLQTLPPVLIARTDCLVAVHEWEPARALIAAGSYGHISSEAVQLAFAARVLRDHDRPVLQRSSWDEAIRFTAEDLSGLRVLHRLALEWRWGPELNAVLLAIATKHPSQSWAYQALTDRYHRAMDTANLKSVYSLWRDAEPAATFVEGNAVFLNLLTEPSKLPSQTKTRAAQLYQSDPSNAFFATTHAFALWQLGRNADAASVFEKLPEIERRAAHRALYVALVLNATGRKVEARDYLSLVHPQTLLPEERELFRTATQALEKPVLKGKA